MRYESLCHLAGGTLAVVATVCVYGSANVGDGLIRAGQPVWAADARGGWVSTYVVVRVEPETRALYDLIVAAESAKTGDRAVDAELARWGATAITPLFDIPFGQPDLAAWIGLDRYYRIVVPRGTDTPKMAKALRELGFFEYAGHDTIGGVADTVPNDPEFAAQWSLRNTGQDSSCGGVGNPDADIDASDAWDLFTGDGNVTLAVIDSGVFDHVDFEHHIDFEQGWNAIDNSNDARDDFGHGTWCAGIAAAVGGNGEGIAGVSWQTRIIPIKVTTDGAGNTTDCAEGVVYGADHGANVETISLGFDDGPPQFQDAITYAWERGVLIVAAAGNHYGMPPRWPARFEQVIGVGATTNTDGIAPFSCQGDAVDISAPGVDILSTIPDNTYFCSSGTSASAPMVAGAACLLWSYASKATNVRIEAALLAGVEDKGDPGKDPAFGWGRLNVNNSIHFVTAGVRIKVPAVPAPLYPPGSVVSFDVTLKLGEDQYVPDSQLLHYRFDDGDYQTLPLVYQTGDTWTATLPAVACGDEPEFYVSAEGIDTGVVTFPYDAPGHVLSFAVGALETTYHDVTGFNNGLPEGWAADGFWHVTSACSVGDSCDGGTYAYFGNDGTCTYKNDNKPSVGTLKAILTLPIVASLGNVKLTYCYTLQTEKVPGVDTARVYIDGNQIDQASESPNAWSTREVDITSYEGQMVELAFTFNSKDGFNNSFRGWQVDGLRLTVTDVVCTGCYPDFTGDGVLDLFDFLGYVNAFNDQDPGADCDGSGGLDLFDFLCFTNAFNAGC
jgi:hypothetical protein